MRVLQPVRTFIVGSRGAMAKAIGGTRARSRSRRARAQHAHAERNLSDRRLVVLAMSAAALVSASVLGGCGGSDSEPTRGADATRGTSAATSTPTVASAAARGWTRGYPDSITVLGHSGSTGESSDPEQPGVEVREN